MKKLPFISLLAVAVLTLSACGAASPTDGTSATVNTEEVNFVEIVDFNGDTVTVRQNPTVVAIYDFSILDILYSIGFERTGIETLIVPTRETLPDGLSWFRDNGGDVQIISGGTLFYVDWDVLDLVDPQLVVLGGRSFGMNAAGDRLSAEDTDQFRSETMDRYTDTAFIRLGPNNQVADILNDMARNVEVLSAIFPDLADDLNAELVNLKAEIDAIHEVVSATDYTALFIMMVDATRMSIFLPESRFGMIYDEFGFTAAGDALPEWTDQHGFETRTEFILELDPDVIFVLDRSNLAEDVHGPAAETFLNDPIIAQTSAFQNGHIYYNLGPAAWYTLNGGFTSMRRMIADVNQFIANISE